MKNILLSTILGSILLTIVSCGTGSGYGPQGAVVTVTSIGVYGNNTAYSKTGEACAWQALGLVSFGDGSVEKAAAAGSISKISMIDLDSLSILGLYSELCTVVKGE